MNPFEAPLREQLAALRAKIGHIEKENLGLLADIDDLREENEKLRERLLPELVCHTYECPIWHTGQKHGPCNCDAERKAANELDVICGRIKVDK